MIYFFKEEKEKERETKIQREKYDIFYSNLLQVRNLEIRIKCIERAYFFFEKNKHSSPKREPLFPKVRKIYRSLLS